MYGDATERLTRARTPGDALALVLRLLLAQRVVDVDEDQASDSTATRGGTR
jgi:hypothetical protein